MTESLTGHRTLMPARPRRTEVSPRPIAASLALSEAHVEAIEHSHERCVALGLSRIELPEFDPLGTADLNVARERNRRLFLRSAPIMGMLFDQIVGTESQVVLCDATGTIIHSIGDDAFLARASKVALAPGVNWSEQSKGTNAIGTALIEEVPTLVHADEHYMHANHFLTCSAAPILDPRGNILGALDVSGDHRSYHRHTMALVRMSARMIENQWLADDFGNLMRLHFHSRPEVLGTLMEGILAVTQEGQIVGANRGALEQLGLSGATLRMQTLSSLFDTTVAMLVDRARLPVTTPIPVRTHSGQRFHLYARFNWPVWHRGAADAADAGAAAPALNAPSAPAMAPPSRRTRSLAHLQTGDAAWDALLDKARRVRDRDIPILIVGETGSGKEVLARAIHQDSKRATQGFVGINCAALGAAELLGEGSVALQLAQAQGGTLFLDEVGELPMAQQLRLLALLQDGHVALSGATGSAALNLALVCASQRPLQARVEAGEFREDLFYRLNGMTLRVPALRERSDISALARSILDDEQAGQHMQLSSEVIELFGASAWPGNVRELFNVLRTAVAMAGTERLITRRHLPEDFLGDAAALSPAQASRGAAVAPPPAASAADPEPRSLEEIEIDAIRLAVDEAGGNISEAAKRLGVSRNTIYRKLRWNQRSSS